MNKTETPLRNRSKNNDIEKEELENNPAVKEQICLKCQYPIFDERYEKQVDYDNARQEAIHML
ncbi:Uncharacterised protein [Proteus mirabilis]|uniref:Uncharacterized protein n=1 Tax=Proteus mirabilis TaxID=584 RepID=A0A379GIV0_PROMI|nr:Uncharacterised protein [Proteus mirabilis]